MKLSKVLKEQRISRNLSQEQLADDLHIARQSISKWERGEAYPSIGMLLKLSDFFKISVDELLRGDDHLKNEIVKDGEKLKYPKLVLFTEWIFLTGAALLFIRLTLALLNHFAIINFEITLLQGWAPSLITLACMLGGGLLSDWLKEIKR
jgi:transcriptional regulator with XRE-family HTH domain